MQLLAATTWRLARTSRLEVELFEAYRFYGGIEGDSVTALVQDAGELDCFSRLATYEARMRISLSWIVSELLG